MDLLYSHITNIPNDETLSGVYIVDGTTMYASTKCNNNQYNLYTVFNHKIGTFLLSSDNLGYLDTVVSSRHFQVLEQSGRLENDIKVVTYITDRFKDKYTKKVSTEKVEISRFTNSRHKKLF